MTKEPLQPVSNAPIPDTSEPRAKLPPLGNAPKLKFEVHEADIALAVPKNSGHCMISDALRRQVPWARRIESDLQNIRVSNPLKGERYVYQTPQNAQHALLDFDRGIVPEPLAVKLGKASVHRIRKVVPGERAKRVGKNSGAAPLLDAMRTPGGTVKTPTQGPREQVEMNRPNHQSTVSKGGVPMGRAILSDQPKPETAGQKKMAAAREQQHPGMLSNSRRAGQRRQFGLKLARE